MTAETEAQWHQLAKAALEDGKLAIAERCYAAVGNIAKAHYLHQVVLNPPPDLSCFACMLVSLTCQLDLSCPPELSTLPRAFYLAHILVDHGVNHKWG